MARKINYNFDGEQMAHLHMQCGESDKPIRDALGYLTLWNLSSNPIVDITILGQPGDMEIIAYYRQEEGGQAKYVIGAVWHDDHFGFHS